MTGTIPAAIANLTKLKTLYINQNFFTDPLPPGRYLLTRVSDVCHRVPVHWLLAWWCVPTVACGRTRAAFVNRSLMPTLKNLHLHKNLFTIDELARFGGECSEQYCSP